MDYGILIFLNLIFLGFFYFLFSIRLGKALEKTKKQGIPREFYENVEMVVRYLDTTLESITQKNEAFYRVVSRADELKKELEALLAEYEKSSKRRKKRPSSEMQESQTPPEPTGPELRGPQKPAAPIKQTDDVRADRTVERLLRDAGEDRIEWSGASNPGDLADLIGAKKDRSVKNSSGKNPQQKGGPAAETVFSGVGRFARRILGLPELPSLPVDEPYVQDNTSTERQRTAKAQEPTPEQRLSFEEELMGYSPKTPYPERAAPIPPPLPEDFRAESTPPPRAVQNPATPESEETRATWLSDLNVPDLSNVKERATFVRTLLQRNVPVEEIAAFTGIPVGEIEFIRKVMENQGSRINRGRGR